MTMAPTADHRRKPRARSAFRKGDVTKAVAAAIAGGMPVGRIRFGPNGFELYALDDSAPVSDADALERRMQEAFGEGGDD